MLDLSSKTTDPSAFQIAAQKVGLPLEVVKLNEARVRELYERPLVLVRPDGHVAWRGDAIPGNVAEVIDRVRGSC